MEDKNYFGYFDILRFAAALWVVITHYGFIGPTGGVTGYALTDNEPLKLFFRMGYLGVPIFFVLSGYLIYHVSENRMPIGFGLNRIARLMPSFWAAILFTFIATSLLTGSLTSSIGSVIANFTLVPQIFGYTFTDGVYWTLLYEFIFYFWFLILLNNKTIYRHFYLICSAWLAISFANSLWWHNGILERAYVTFYSGAFVAGMTLSRMKKGDQGLWPLFMLCFAALSLSFGIQRLHIVDNIEIQYDSMPFLGGLGWSIFCIGLIALGSKLKAPASWKANCTLLGAISYPLYLIHQEAGYALLQKLEGTVPPVLAATLTAMVAILVAYSIHKWVEKRLQVSLRALFNRFLER